MGADDERVAEVADRLTGLAEELADLALERLRRAADPEAPDPEAAAAERRLTRARRAVERAAGILRPQIALDEP